MAELRPLTFGEILDGALTLYRRHFGLFLQLSVVVLVVPVALYGYMVAPMLMNPMYLMFDPVGAGIRVAAIFLVLYLASLLLTAATVRVVSDSYLGRTPGFRASMALGLSKIWPLFLVGLAKGVLLGGLAGVVGAAAIGGGFMFDLRGMQSAAFTTTFVVSLLGAALVIWLACGYAVTTQVVVLGRWSRALEAFGQSWRLTRGSRFKVFGLGAVAFLLFLIVPNLVFTILAVLMAMNPTAGLVMQILQLVVPMLLAPAVACVFTLMYYDLRMRREAFDLQALGEQLGPA